MLRVEIIIFCCLVAYAIATAIGIAADYTVHQSINWLMVIFEFFMIFLILCMLGVFRRKETIKKSRSHWQFQNYEEARTYLENEKPHLQYEQEDKERLVVLLFFGWNIKDDSNPDALVLERKEIHYMKQKIFIPTKKGNNNHDV